MAGLVPAIPTCTELAKVAVARGAEGVGMAGTDPRNKSGDGHDGLGDPCRTSIIRAVGISRRSGNGVGHDVPGGGHCAVGSDDPACPHAEWRWPPFTLLRRQNREQVVEQAFNFLSVCADACFEFS